MLLSVCGAASLALAAHAVPVSLNTSSLAGGTYYVDFQLNDGSGTGNGNNHATLQNFNFGGGAATGAANAFGGVTGDLSVGVALTDSDPFNEFYQSFTAGSFLGFNLLLSDNPEAGVSDIFTFALLDANLLNLGTFSLGSDQFLTVNLNGTGLVFETFAGIDGLPQPHVPETGGPALLLALTLTGMAAFRRAELRRTRA